MGHSPKSCNSFHLHVILLVSAEGEKEQTVQHSPLTAREINKKKGPNGASEEHLRSQRIIHGISSGEDLNQ